MSAVVTAAAAAVAHVASVAHDATGEEKFNAGALLFHGARHASKVSAPSLGREVKAEGKRKGITSGLYTSNSMIDAYALTGAILSQDGETDLTGRQIQTEVRKAEKACGMPATRKAVLAGTEKAATLATLADMVTAAEKAAREAEKAEKAAAKAAATEETEETATEDAPKVSRYVVALDLLTAASNDGEIMPEDVRAGLLAILDAARVDA